MARHKGATPDNTAKDAAEDVAVALESAAEEMTVMEEGAEATVYASGSAEAEESLHGNLVVESVRSGAAAAQEAVARFVPAVGDNLRKAAYKGIYGVSFGVTFGALFVSRLVPKDSFVGHALADGAAAAKAAFHEQQERAAAAEHAAPLSPAAA